MRAFDLLSVSFLALSVFELGAGKAMAQNLEDLGVFAPDPGTQLVITADEVLYDTSGQVATARGDAEAFFGDRALGADELIYDNDAGIVAASGNVALSNDDGSFLFADEARLQVDLVNGEIEQPRLLIDGGTRLSAAQGERVDDRFTVLSKAVYSPCDVCTDDPVPLWRIRAEQVIHDEETRDITYKDAVFDIEGVSVLYVPYFRHPDPTVKRRTGFLSPEYGNDNTIGATLKTPYFIDLAPNRDLTITPFVATNDGLLLEAEYRARTHTGQYRLEAFATVDDAREGDDEFRGAVEGEGFFDLGSDRYWGFNLDLATDDTFLRRYLYSDEDRVTSRVFVGQQTDTLFAEANALYFQSFQEDEPDDTIPNGLPEIRLDHRFLEDETYGVANVSGNAVRLFRSDGLDYNRLNASAEWERQIITSFGASVTPFAQADVAGYFIEDTDEFDDFEARAVAAGGIDIRYPFIAEHANVTHIIEPIAQGILANDVNDMFDIPNEDSVDVEFDETSLFLTESRFPGEDRFEGGTRFNVGVRYNAEGNGWSFDSVYGRVFRLEENLDFSENSGLRDQSSDHVGAFSFRFPPYLSLTNRFRVGDEDFDIRRNEFTAAVSVDRFKGELDYVFLEADPLAGFDDDRQEISGSMSLRLTDTLTAYGDARRDIEDSRFVDSRAGLRFENECCSIDANVSRRFNEDRDADDGLNFGLRLRLKTLGG